MKLNEQKCKHASREKDGAKLFDGHGLYLELNKNGSKYWRYKYRFHGKEKLYSIGVYPEISLKEARELHREAHKMVSLGSDPNEMKQEQKRESMLNAENTFESIAREWLTKHRHKVSEGHAQTIEYRLEKEILPALGRRPIRDITAPEILAMLQKIEKRGAYEMAKRCKQYCGQILRYGIATGRAERDHTADLKDALTTKKVQHLAALDPRDLPEFLHALRQNHARLYTQTRMAMEFLMLTFVRTNELINARWEEIDFDNATWYIPAERMKMRQPHVVPLCTRALEILEELKQYPSPHGWVFPSPTRPRNHMSNNAILQALKRMGYNGKMTGHGFRALAMTTIKERLGYRHEVVDRQLAHAHRNKVDAAYDRAQFLDERRKMMQEWADYLEKL